MTDEWNIRKQRDLYMLYVDDHDTGVAFEYRPISDDICDKDDVKADRYNDVIFALPMKVQLRDCLQIASLLNQYAEDGKSLKVVKKPTT